MKKPLKYLWLSILTAPVLLPGLAIAQNCAEGDLVQDTLCLPKSGRAPWSGVETLSGAVGIILTWAITIVGLISVLFIVVGGYRYMTAGGEEERIKEAKRTILNAIIGVVVVLLALAIVRIVANLVSGNV